MYAPLWRKICVFVFPMSIWLFPQLSVAEEESATIEEVVVTGSRIQRANLTQPNPVYGLDSGDIKASGELSVVEVLKEVPALLSSNNGTQANFFTAENAAGFNDTPGLATLDLRSLGTNRTLVLVDGKRHVSGQAGNQAVDIESMPTALIDRVEVLTGGASSIYGADAVSGVVNFIMKDDFEGTQFELQTGRNGDGDAGEFMFSFTHGMNFADDRGNVAFFGTYRQRDEVLVSDRSFSRDGGIAGIQQENSRLRFQEGDMLPAGAFIGDLIATTDAGGNCIAAVTGTSQSLVDRACNARPSRVARNLSFGLTHPGGLLALALADDITAATPTRATSFPLFHTSADLGLLAPGTPFQDFDGNGIDDCTESYVGQFSVGGCSIVDPRTRQLRAFSTGQIGDAVLNFDGVGGDGFRQNGQPDETLVPEYDQTVLGGIVNFEINDRLRFVGELKYSLATSKTGGGGAAFFDTINISPENPFVPAEAQQLLTDILALNPQFTDSAQFFLTRDPTDINIDDEYERETFRVVAGFEGELLDNWTWETSVIWGRTTEEAREHTLLNDRFFAAVDVVADANGNPVCRSEVEAGWTIDDFNNDSIFGDTGVNTFTPGDGSCVPMNVFGLGAPSREAQAWVAPVRRFDDEIEQLIFSAVMTGDSERWFSLPGGPVNFAVGLEYREEESETVPDAFEQAGFYFNSQTSVTEGEFDVKEFFAEVSLPLLADVPGASELVVDAAYRYSDYDLEVDTTNSWSYGLSWAPISDIRFRATQSRAVRAPNIFELFSPVQQTTFNLDIDPCDQGAIDALAVADPTRAANRTANCAADPLVGANFSNPLTSNFQGTTGGNMNLIEETADTLTFGIVIQPRFIEGLVITVDKWEIEIEDAIQVIQDTDVLNGCYDGPGLDPTFCSQFSRVSDPTSGFFGGLNFLQVGQINFANLETEGTDFEITYQMLDVLGGAISLRANATYLEKYDAFRSTLNPELADDEVGEMLLPEWSGNFSATWSTDQISVQWRAQYIDEVAHRLVEIDQVASFDNAFADDIWIHDVSASYSFGDDYQYTIYGGINNVADEDPFDTQPSFPTGALGRYFYLGGTFRL